MVRYSKEYGDAFFGLVDLALGLLINAADNFIVHKFNKRKYYNDYSDRTGGKYNGKQMSNQFYELKRRGYIEETELEGERAIRLTDKAKLKIVEKIVARQPSDRRLRYVSFDIPERLHYQRDLFRRTIKRIGFHQIQQSLWAIDKNVGKLVEIAAKEYKVEDYIAYIVSEGSNIDVHARRILSQK